MRVSYSWLNASPEIIESQVTQVLEGAFRFIPEITNIYSVSGNGKGHIDLTLETGRPTEQMRFEIASRIRQIYPSLPPSCSYPTITSNSPNSLGEQGPLMIYALSGSTSYSDLQEYAQKRISLAFAFTGGIDRVEVRGGAEKVWQLKYDAAQIKRLGIRPGEILRAVRSAQEKQTIGTVFTKERYGTLTLAPQATTADELKAFWKKIPVKRIDKCIIYLSDIAELEQTVQPPQRFYRINGENSVRLLIYAQPNANRITLARRIEQAVRDLRSGLPASYRLSLEDDQSQPILEEVVKIRNRTLWSLTLLLLMVLSVYRSLSTLLIIICSLLANLGIAFFAYYLAGITLHIYALAAITLSLGLIIDNTLIVLHQVQHTLNRPVFAAILSSSATTAAALGIFFLLPEHWRIALEDFAIVLSLNLAISLAVAKWLVPALIDKLQTRPEKRHTKRYLKKHMAAFSNKHYSIIKMVQRHRTTGIIIILLAFGLPVFLLPRTIPKLEWYNKSFGSDWYLKQARPVVDKVLGGSLRLFSEYVFESGYYREKQDSRLFVKISMPVGTTAAQMDQLCAQVERYLAQYSSALDQFTTEIISGQYAVLQIRFNPSHQRSFPVILKERLIALSLNKGGAAWDIYGVGLGFNNLNSNAPPRYRVQLKGYQKQALEQAAERFGELLLTNPRIDQLNLNANINWREKDLYVFQLGAAPYLLSQNGYQPSMLYDELKPFNQLGTFAYSLVGDPLYLSPKDVKNRDLWSLQQNTPSALLRQLNDESITKQKKPISIHKENQSYLQLASYEYLGERRFGDKATMDYVEKIRQELPLGYSISVNAFEQYRERSQLYKLLPVVLVFIYIIVVIHFESFRLGAAIILLAPLSFIGIFLVFYCFRIPFDQGGYISFLLVSGLTVNSLILILHDFNYFRKKRTRCSSAKLYQLAYRGKITPITLSVLSTALGMLPFLLYRGNDIFWPALAAGSIGGLLFSLVIITFITPLFLRS